MAITNSDGSIILKTKVDTSGLKKGMSSMKSGVSSLTGAFGKLAGAMAVVFSVDAIVKFSKESSNLATKTEASVQRLIDIYGSASRAVGDFIDANANALGMSKAAAASYASVYGNLFSVWADQKTNAELTNRYLNMTAVVASKTGRTVEDVQERIRSGLLGNTEAIEDLGVFVNVKTIEMTDAFKRMANGKSWEQLDAYAQQQIRTLAILEQATAKYGDEVSQTTALTKAQYNAAFEDFKNTWGTVVNYVLMPVLRVLAQVLQMATAALQAVFKISGKTINVDDSSFQDQENAIGGAVENQKDLTGAVKETEKEQKKLLAGFDDLEILGQNSNDGGVQFGEETGSGDLLEGLSFVEGQGEQIIDTTAFENLKKILSDIKNIFMDGFWEGFKNVDLSALKRSIIGIKDALIGIFTSTEVTQSAKGYVTSVIKAFGQIVGSVSSIGITIATNLLGGFNRYLQTNAPFIQSSIAKILDASSGIVQSVGNMCTAFANIFNAFLSTDGQNITANIIGIFNNAWLAAQQLATQIGEDFIKFLTQPIIDNQDNIKGALEGTLKSLSGLTDELKKIADDVINILLGLYEEHISPFIDDITEDFSEFVGQIIDGYNEEIKPLVDEFVEELRVLYEENIAPTLERVAGFIGRIIEILRELWNNVLKPIVSWLIDYFIKCFANTFETAKRVVRLAIKFITDNINNIIDTAEEIIDFIKNVFEKDWEGAWGNLQEIFEGIINGILLKFQTMINFLITSVNGFIGKINPLVEKVGDWVNKDWELSEIKQIEIPPLAKGAVIPPNREFLAVLGDQKQGTNIEAPLQTIVDAFNIALANNGGVGAGNTEVVLEIDGREFGRAVVEQGNRENRRIGTRLVVM